MGSHTRVLGYLVISLALAGCVNTLGTHLVTGQTRPATDVSDVVLYATAPADYVVIGQVGARSTIFSSEQVKTDKAVARLKEEAAEMGANGILLQVENPASLGKRPGIVVTPDKIGGFVTDQNHDVLVSGQAIYVPGQKP